MRKCRTGIEFYTLDEIKKRKARYNVIFGRKSTGKTFAVLEEAARTYWTTGTQLAYIRRWDMDITAGRGAGIYRNLIEAGKISEITDGTYDSVVYKSRQFFFAKTDEEGETQLSPEPFGYAFSLTSQEHDNSIGYPRCDFIVFEEFASKDGGYLPDEFAVFCRVLSNIIRHRDTAVIYMLGNSLNRYCPYFSEMGLTHIKDMEPGTIDVYTYNKPGLTVAVEFADLPSKSSPSDVYFAFDNPKLSVITGQGSAGAWMIDVYPRCPYKYRPDDVLLTYFIQFDDALLQAEIVRLPDNAGSFTFIHDKTTPIQHPDKDIVFTQEVRPEHNYRRRITLPRTKLDKVIYEYFLRDKVYYSTNVVGDTVSNYLKWCRTAV